MVTGLAAATSAVSVVVAAANGWTSPTGVAAVGTMLIGGGAFVWSIVQARQKRREIDLDAARELFKLVKEVSDEDK